MEFVITNAGIAAARAAQTNGFKIAIKTFRVGSAFDYTPVAGDSRLRGTELYSQNINNQIPQDSDTVRFVLIMDRNVGNFSYGEMGLYLEDGTLFALGAYSTLQTKTMTSSSLIGNRIEVIVDLKLTQFPTILTVVMQSAANGRLPTVNIEDVLPKPDTANLNAYTAYCITGNADARGNLDFALPFFIPFL